MTVFNNEELRIPRATRAQIIAGIVAGKDALTAIQECLKALNNSLSTDGKRIEDEYEKYYHTGRFGSFDPDVLSACDRVFRCLNANAAALESTSNRLLKCLLTDWDEASADGDGAPCVDIHLDQDGIFVKLPMLPTRNPRPSKKGGDKLDLRIEIIRAFERSEGFSSYDFLRFGEKIVQFLYVYDPAQNFLSSRLIDNDNHDTKPIQDAIVLFTPRGDAPLSCSNFSSATLSNKVPEGTYVTVSEARNGIQTAEKIIAKWAAWLRDPAENTSPNLP